MNKLKAYLICVAITGMVFLTGIYGMWGLWDVVGYLIGAWISWSVILFVIVLLMTNAVDLLTRRD